MNDAAADAAPPFAHPLPRAQTRWLALPREEQQRQGSAPDLVATSKSLLSNLEKRKRERRNDRLDDKRAPAAERALNHRQPQSTRHVLHPSRPAANRAASRARSE